MKIIAMSMLFLVFFSGCGNSVNDEGISDDFEATTEATSIEVKDLLLFDEWLASSNMSNKELVLPAVDEMTPEEIISHYQSELEVPDESVAVAYSNLQTGEYYHFRENEEHTAASTTKVLLAMLYFDLVDEGEMTFDTLIPYYPSLYQGGGGELTASVSSGNAHASYPLDYIIQEMIVRSDNTATYMLRHYFRTNFGSLGEGMKNVVEGSGYTADMLEYNTTTAALLQEGLAVLPKKGYYAQILDHMRLADEDMYFKYYIDEDMPVKHGMLNELQHHTGIYEIDGKPMYNLVILTSYLGSEQVNEFMGGINLQLAAQAEYQNYMDTLN